MRRFQAAWLRGVLCGLFVVVGSAHAPGGEVSQVAILSRPHDPYGSPRPARRASSPVRAPLARLPGPPIAGRTDQPGPITEHGRFVRHGKIGRDARAPSS